MKFLKLFEQHADYETYINGPDKILPNISYCENEKEVHYNPYVEETRVVATFNITSTSEATTICYSGDTIEFTEIEIDGVVQPSVVSTYTFDTMGEHTVKYTLADPTQISDDCPFYECTSLTSITIPDSVTSIGNDAFYGCTGLTSINIPSGVTRIGGGAFNYCSSLTSITIPNGLTSIASNIFYYCSGLTNITVESSNTVYDSRNNCNAIIETSTNTLIMGCKNTVIPNSVTSIGNYAFLGCTSLTSVTIPSSITSIGGGAFSNCSGLTNVTIPDSVTTIGVNAFEYCLGLTSITIPNSITSISGGVFNHCCGLTSITIPDSVTSIGQTAFSYCSGFTSFTIPNSVTNIGGYAFGECTILTSVTIGSGVTTIGQNAFTGCGMLNNITSLATTAPNISNYTFQLVKTGGTLYVPSGSTGYNVWMGTGNYYLGKYSWTKVEQ